jgi:hypothetical protein
VEFLNRDDVELDVERRDTALPEGEGGGVGVELRSPRSLRSDIVLDLVVDAREENWLCLKAVVSELSVVSAAVEGMVAVWLVEEILLEVCEA